MDALLVEHALHMAWLNHNLDHNMLHYSDQVSQSTSEAYQNHLIGLNCQVSMSRTGNCDDNAVVKSFYSSLTADHNGKPLTTRMQVDDIIDMVPKMPIVSPTQGVL